MEYLILTSTVAIITLLAVMSPGPDFIMVIKNSLTYSRKTGIMTSIGVGLGMTIHIAYSVAGVAVLISQSIIVFNMIKFIGAGYLIYLGINSILSKGSNIEISQGKKKEDISWFKAVKIGFLTNVLNPKATLFFLSLFTMVVSPKTPVLVISIISFVIVSITIIWFSLISVFFTQKKVVKVFNKFQNIFNKIFGSMLIGLGIKVALTEK